MRWRGLDQYYDTQALLSDAKPLFIISLLNAVIANIDVLLLAFFTSAVDVALYSIVVRITLVYGVLLTTFNSIYGPRFANFWANDENERMVKEAVGCTFLMLALAVSLLVLICLVAEPLLAYFGEDFVSVRWVLYGLTLCNCVVLATGPAAQLLVMTGHVQRHKKIVYISAAISILLNVSLIPMFGLVGAAWALGVSMILKNMMAFYAVYKTLDFCLYDYRKLAAR